MTLRSLSVAFQDILYYLLVGYSSLLLIVCMCVSECGDMHMSAGALRVQRYHITLKLESQVVVGCLMWVLGIKIWSSARALTALNH